MTEIQPVVDQAPEPAYENVQIFDTTLRDGEQSPGVAFDKKDKLMIASRLAELGVDIIEAGFPINSVPEFEAVQAVAQQIEGPVITALSRAERRGDIDRAAEAIRDAERPRIHTFISTSDIHIEHQLQSTREEVKAYAQAGVAHAKSFVDDVEFSPMDATRADIEFTAEICEIAIEEGATVINIPDTVGYTQPFEFQEYLEKLQSLVPSIGNITLSVHCHDDLGLAVANSFAGVRASARQVEVAINGIGERAGNTSLEEFVMLLRTRRQVDGYDTNINTPLLGPISRMLSKMTGYAVPPNKAIVGKNAFQHEAGIHQDGVLRNRKTFEIMEAAQVGMDPNNIVLGKSSGRNAVIDVLEKEGVYKAPCIKKTMDLLKDAATEIKVVSAEQAVALHEEAERRQTNPYQLDYENFRVEKNGNHYSAFMRVNIGGSTREADISSSPEHPNVDGRVSAIFEAAKIVTSSNYMLKEHSFVAIGEGEKTIGEATVKLVGNGQIVTGKGLSTDSDKATAWAYLHAVSKAQNV